MYSVSTAFLTAVRQQTRTLQAKVIIGTTEIDTVSIDNFTINCSIGSNSLPSIGSTISNSLELTLINDGTAPSVLVGVPIKPSVAIDTSGTGTFEWVSLGVFYASYDGVNVGKLETIIDSYDNMYSYTNITYNATSGTALTIAGVLGDLATNFGVTFADYSALPTSTVLQVLPTGTVRQVLGELASLMSTNATCDENGKVKFVFLNTIAPATFQMDTTNYSTFQLQPDSQIKISELQATQSDNSVLASGDATGYSLSLTNENITTLTQLNTVATRILPLYYYSYTMTAQGMPHLQVGDVITFTYLKLDGTTATIQVPILTHKFTFGGGMTSQFSATAPIMTITDINTTGGGSLTKAVFSTVSPTVQTAINNATAIMTGNKGGFVITVMDAYGKPVELCICDSPDLNTAKNVWRWNNSGLGFSSTGYSGTYGTAITSDGSIVADMMTTGTLNANLVNVVNLKATSLDVGTQNTLNSVVKKADTTYVDGQVSQTNTQLSSQINSVQTSVNTLNQYMHFDSTTGLTLSQASSPLQITISNDTIHFQSSGQDVAYINGNKMVITEADMTKAIIGVHSIEKYDSDTTIVRWVGGS